MHNNRYWLSYVAFGIHSTESQIICSFCSSSFFPFFVQLATASLLDLGQISVTPSLVNVLVRHWHTEEDAASANLGTMAFPTVSRASVMDTPSLVTRSLESVSAAR